MLAKTHHFFVNHRQVRIDFSTFQNTKYLIKIFQFLGINEIVISPQITQKDLALFLHSFLKVVQDKEGRLIDYTIPNLKIRKLKLGKVHPLLTGTHPAEKVCAWYARALQCIHTFYLDATLQRVPKYSEIKKIALNLIELPTP